MPEDDSSGLLPKTNSHHNVFHGELKGMSPCFTLFADFQHQYNVVHIQEGRDCKAEYHENTTLD